MNIDDEWDLFENEDSYDSSDSLITIINNGDNADDPRKPKLNLEPSSNFEDTGTDGCYDELEDGSGNCLCEFKTGVGDNSDLDDCWDKMVEWYGDNLINVYLL